MIFIHRSAEPDILTKQGKTKQLALCNAYDQGQRTFEFKSSVYGHETVKTVLKTMQHDKCCFCEAKFEHISYGDVEHYRPKGGYQQDDSEPLQKTGYYWLAYTWDNLLLSCTRCNQQHKKNYFPLLQPENRARSHHDDIGKEEPLLLNPSKLNPQDYIGFRSEIPYAIHDHAYGKTTIAVLGLAREPLNEDRRTKLAEIILLVKLVMLAEKQTDNFELQTLAAQAKKKLDESVLATAEYSAMTIAYLAAQS